MKKVIHCMRWFLPFTGSFIRNQIIHHKRYQPSIVYAQKKESFFHEELSGRFETFSPFDGAGFDLQLYDKFRRLSPSATNKIKSFIQKTDPNLLHIHYGVDCAVYADIIRELDIPACVSFYGYDCTSFPKRFYGYGKRILQKKVFGNPNVKAVLAMTEDMAQDLIALGCPEEKVIVHYYGTETAPFYDPHERQANGQVNYLIISGLHPKKGHSILMDAFKELSRSTDKKVQLNIVGDGPLRQQIEQEALNSGLDNIIVHGPVSYGSKEHFNFLKTADVFVHPSIMPPDGDKEGIPGAIIEAMAAGLPVVSTYHAGIPYVIENEKTGLLVEERDVKGLSNAMKRMAEEDQLRLAIARAGQTHAREHLDVENKEIELEEIYDTLSS